MIDLPARAALKTALADLIEGRITNDQFADLHAGQWAESADRAVVTIGEFGDGLYTDAMTYRLTGNHAPDGETRRTADRCLRFLETDLEYTWPDPPNTAAQEAAGGAAVFLGLPFGAVLLIAALFFWTVGLLLAGMAALGLSWLLWRWSRQEDTPEWREYWAHGERDAWPFRA